MWLTLYPMPTGVTGLHFPSVTITKKKFELGSAPIRSADTLELDVMLVSATAMRKNDLKQRAFKTAAERPLPAALDESEPPKNSERSYEDLYRGEFKPLDGGEVKICSLCLSRERQRSRRKAADTETKTKEKPPPKKSALIWEQHEHKRVMIFGTNETETWAPPKSDSPAIVQPDGAMQIKTPMRVMCYCRHHQNEKIGYQ